MVPEEVVAIQDHIYPYVKNDPKNSYTEQQFYNMLDQPIGTTYGIIQYFPSCISDILAQIDNSNTSPTFTSPVFKNIVRAEILIFRSPRKMRMKMLELFFFIAQTETSISLRTLQLLQLQ
jgi:hypothetical protein